MIDANLKLVKMHMDNVLEKTGKTASLARSTQRFLRGISRKIKKLQESSIDKDVKTLLCYLGRRNCNLLGFDCGSNKDTDPNWHTKGQEIGCGWIV